VNVPLNATAMLFLYTAMLFLYRLMFANRKDLVRCTPHWGLSPRMAHASKTGIDETERLRASKTMQGHRQALAKDLSWKVLELKVFLARARP
jgi:hypothetical protein